MAFDLEIVVGGLCMFVQRKEAGSEGLYVLMPIMPMADAAHVPLLYHKSTAGKATWLSLNGRVTSLRHLKAKKPTTTTFGSEFAAVSTYAGGKRVRRACMAIVDADDPVPSPLLAARLDLPPGGTIQAIGWPAEVQVDYGTGTKKQDLYGVATITYSQVDAKEVSIAGTTFSPDAAGHLQLRVGNVALPDIGDVPTMDDPPGPPAKPQVGRIVEHFPAYYSLLAGCGSTHHGTTKCGPDLVVRKSRGEGSGPKGQGKASGTAFFIDPYKCTLGWGCDPDDPDDCPT